MASVMYELSSEGSHRDLRAACVLRSEKMAVTHLHKEKLVTVSRPCQSAAGGRAARSPTSGTGVARVTVSPVVDLHCVAAPLN